MGKSVLVTRAWCLSSPARLSRQYINMSRSCLGRQIEGCPVAITPGGSPQEMSNLSGKLRCVAYARIPYRYWYCIAIFLSKRKKKGEGGKGAFLGRTSPAATGTYWTITRCDLPHGTRIERRETSAKPNSHVADPPIVLVSSLTNPASGGRAALHLPT